MKILLVEDDAAIAAAIADGLRQERFAVDIEGNGQNAYYSIIAQNYDVIILDIMLPDMDGIELAQSLRKQSVHIPILMLSAKDQLIDKVTGLNIGADDYMTKPFAFDELLARVKALLRRPSSAIGQKLQIDTLSLDTVSSLVMREDEVIQLSAKEYAILEYLMRNKQQIISKNNLINHVWEFDSDILPHTVEVNVANLRAKVDKPFKKQLIHTVRGFGYTVKE